MAEREVTGRQPHEANTALHISWRPGKGAREAREPLFEADAVPLQYKSQWVQANSPECLTRLFSALVQELRAGFSVVHADTQIEPHDGHSIIEAFLVRERRGEPERKPLEIGMVTLYEANKTPTAIKISPASPTTADALSAALERTVAACLSGQGGGAEVMVSEKEPPK